MRRQDFGKGSGELVGQERADEQTCDAQELLHEPFGNSLPDCGDETNQKNNVQGGHNGLLKSGGFIIFVVYKIRQKL